MNPEHMGQKNRVNLSSAPILTQVINDMITHDLKVITWLKQTNSCIWVSNELSWSSIINDNYTYLVDGPYA